MATKKKTSRAYESEYTKASPLGIGDLTTHGDPGSGKTTLTCSVSCDWPFKPGEPLKRQRSRVTLRDILIVGWDRAAIRGVQSLNIEPAYYLDMPTITAEDELTIMRAIDVAASEGYDICNADKAVRFVVQDTVTMLAMGVQNYWLDAKNIPRNAGGEENVQRAWNYILNTHMNYYNELAAYPHVDHIFNFHSRAIEIVSQEKRDADKINVHKAKTLVKQGGDPTVNVIPDIAGQALQYYTANVCMELVVQDRKEKKGGKTVHNHVVHTENTVRGQRTKNRYRHLFPATMPAHLGQMKDTILKSLK